MAPYFSKSRFFQSLFDIDSSLRDFLRILEKHFSIQIDNGIVEQIYTDAAEDQVSGKHYQLFKSKKHVFKPTLIIHGTVDQYEPDSIWIEVRNITVRDLNFLNGLMDAKNT